MTSITRTLLGAACVTALLLTTQPAHAADLCDAIGVPIVVRGRVTSLITEPRGTTATVQIIHVYRGLTESAGKTFEDFSRRQGSLGMPAASPPLREGEEGLWTLAESRTGPQRKLVPIPWVSFFRTRKDVSPRYPQELALAEALERLCHTPADRQVALAYDYALSDTPELASFAIRAQIQSRSPDTDEVVERLAADERLKIAGQVMLDEALSQVRGADWQTSPRRLALLRRWVGGPPDAANYARLNDAVEHQELDVPTYLVLMKTAAGNAALPTDWRTRVVASVGRIVAQNNGSNRAITVPDEAAALAWLADRVREPGDSAIRLAAAQQLHAVAGPDVSSPLARRRQEHRLPAADPRAEELVRQLLDSVSDEKVRAALQGK